MCLSSASFFWPCPGVNSCTLQMQGLVLPHSISLLVPPYSPNLWCTRICHPGPLCRKGVMCRLRSGSRLRSLTILLLRFLSSVIRRQLCLLLNAENIFHSMADILLREEDLKFASTMVHTLNTILLTSSELFQLRNQLKDLKTPVWAAGAGSAAGGHNGGGEDLTATWGHVLLLGPHLAGPRAGAGVPRVAPLFLHS